MGMMSMSTLRIRITSIARFVLIAVALGALTTCDLFKTGLGSKIDVTAPTIDVTSLKNGDYINSSRTLSGTAGDDVRVVGVDVSVYSGSTLVATLPATISGAAWSVVLDPTALFPNQQVQADLAIRVTDDSGKTTDRRLVLYFDTVKPTISSLNPAMATLENPDNFLSETVSFQGGVMDGFGVESISFLAGGTERWSASCGTTAWTVYADTTAYTAGAGGVTSLGGGVLKVPLSIVATDKAGNQSDPITGYFLVDQNRSAPWITGPKANFFSSTTNYYPMNSLDPDSKTTMLAPEEQLILKLSDTEGIDASSIAISINDMSTAEIAAKVASTPGFAYEPPFSSEYAVGEEGYLSYTLTAIQEDGERLLKAEVSITLPSAAKLTLRGRGLGEYALSVSAADDIRFKQSLPAKPAVVATRSLADISITISNAVPTVVVSSPANGSIVQDLAASGTIEDGVGISSVSVGVDGEDGTPATLSVIPGAGKLSGSWTFAPGTPLPEGTHTIEVSGKNVGDKQSAVIQRQFIVDRTSPVLEILSIAPATTSLGLRPSVFADVTSAGDAGGAYNKVNGIARIRISATDQNPLQSVTWRLARASDSAVIVPDTAVSSWTVDLNTTSSGASALSLSDGSKYVFTVVAADKAGNSTTSQRTLWVSQDGDEPVITLKNLTALATTSAMAASNLMLSNPRIEATVVDDDWVDSSSIRLLVDEAPGDPSPTWIALSGTRSSDGSVSAGYAIPTSPSPDGRHYFYLRAADTDVNGTDGRKAGLGSTSGTIGPVHFAIDLTPPDVSFDGATEGLYASSTKTLSGAVSSNVALDSSAPLTFSFNGGAAAAPGSLSPAASSSGTHSWGYSLDVSAVPDGPRTLVATATDEFGVSSTRTLSVTVDKVAPEVSATNAAQYFSDVRGLSLVGTIRDITSGVASLTATVTRGATDVSADTVLTLNAAASTPNTLSTWSLDLSDPDLSTGTYSVALRAVDKAGNANDVAAFAINVDKDLPVATIADVLGSPVAGAVYNAASVMPADWSGAASDAFLSSRELSIDGAAPVALASDNWTRAIGWAGLAEGTHTLGLTVTDLGGHSSTARATFVKDTLAPTLSINKPDASAWIGGASYTVRGAADDLAGQGVDRVYVLADAASVDHSADSIATIEATWSLAGGTVSWNQAIDLAALGEGLWTLWVVSADKAGNWNSAPSSVDFGVDQNLPNLSVSSPATIATTLNATTGAAFAGFSGRAWDSNSLASLSVTYTKTGGTTISSPISVGDSSHAAPGNAWSWSPFTHGAGSTSPDVAGHSDDGSYTFVFTATDVSGKQASSAMYSMTVDTSIPTVYYSYPSSGTSINGLATIRGSSSDNAQVTAVEYSLDGGTGWSAAAGDVYSWSFSFDTRAAAQGGVPGLAQGAFSLRVRSRDASGNYSAEASLPLVLDQSTDYPSITLTNMDQSVAAPAGAAANLLESNAKVQGSISDDDWVDASTIMYSIDGGGWSLASIRGASSTTVSFEQSLTSLSDGVHYLQIRASDTNDGANGRKGGLTSVSTTLTSVYFAVDKANPVLVISTPASAYTTGPVSLSGTVTDGNESEHVQVSTDGGATYSATGVVFTAGSGSRNWSWSGSLASAPEGPFTIKVKGIDHYGKESVADVILTVDRTGPAMSVSTPALGSTVNGPVTISGLGVETYGLASVQVAIMPQGTPPAAGDWKAATGTYAWTYPFDSTTAADGAYTVSIRGYDTAGNVSASVATRNFTISQASDKPLLNLATLLTGGSYVQNLLPGSLQISGTASDDDAVGHLTIQIRIDANDDGDFDDGVVNGVSENWSSVGGQPAIDSNIVNWTHTFDMDTDGAGADTGLVDGKYRLEIRVGDINFASAHPGFASVAEWSTLSDANKWTTTGTVRFSVDSAAPAGAVTAPAQGSYLPDPGAGYIRISGTASDGSGIQGVQIKVGAGAATAVEDDGGATHFSAWHYDYSIASDGQVSYQIIITDNYNKITTIDRYFTIDRTAPTSAFLQPTSGSTSNGVLTIRGTSSDTYQVAGVRLWIGAHGAAPAGDPEGGDWTGWTLLAGTYNWQYVLDTRTLANGNYDARVRAVDGAGNVSAAVALSGFNIDQGTNAPVITVTNLNSSAATLFGSGGTISGTVSDDDGVVASTIEISFLDGAAGTWLPVSHGSDGYNVAWSFAIPAGIADSAAAYAVRVRASDVGQTVDGITVPAIATTTDAYQVAVDRADPAPSFDSIHLVNRYTSAPITRSGAAMSGAKLFNNFTVWIAASSSAASIDHPLSVSVSVNGAAAVGAAYSAGDGVWQFAVPISVDTHADDGNMTLAVTAIDRWGRQGSASLGVVIDTQEPVVTVSQPTPGSSVNGTVTLAGTTFEAGGLASLTMRGGIANAPSPATFANTGTAQAWAAQFAASTYDNPTYAQVVGTGIDSVDAAADTITTSAAHGLAANDLVYFYGTTLPGLSASAPYYVMAGAAGSTFRVSATRGGSTAVDISGAVSGAYVRKNGIVWRFPVAVTAIDSAGNESTATLDLYLDRNGDKPVIVDATLMPAAGASVSGAILLQSTVTDDDAPDYVRVYADLNDDGIITAGAYQRDLNGDSDYADPFETENAYLQIDVTNGVWSSIVNNANEFSKASIAARGVSGATGWMQFQVVPYDVNDTPGNVSIRRVYVDSSAPAFGGLNYANGALVRGGITLSGYIEDDADLNTGDIQISYDGGTSFAQLAGLSAASTVGGMRRRTFSQPIDTASVASSILYVVLKATDATYKQNQVNLNFSVDNSRPSATWNYPVVLVPISGTAGSGSEVYGFSGSSGASARIYGQAIDSGAISGIDHVDVYFVKDGNLLNPKTGLSIAAPNSVAGDGLYDQAGALRTGIPYTSDAYGPGGAGTHYAIRIDKRTELGQFDANGTLGDGDGFNESLQAKTGSPNYDEWYSYFNSASLPDGPLTIYFVAYDEAGNKSYATANAQIQNNPPNITGFADHSAPALPFEAYDGYLKAKKSGTFSLDISAQDLNVNPGLNGSTWSLAVSARYGSTASGDLDLANQLSLGLTGALSSTAFYGTGGVRDFSPKPSGSSATATVEIRTATAGGDGFVDGYWYRMDAEVRDADGNLATKTFYLKVNNSDTQAPDVTIDAFDQHSVGRAEMSSSAVNATADVFSYALPAWMVDGTRVLFVGASAPGGFVKGTTYFIVNRTASTFQLSATSGGAAINITSSPSTYYLTAEGHVEAAADSGHDGLDADLAGTVVITGTASDATAVSSVTVEINGAVLGSATVRQVSGNPVAGYQYTWDYVWNTATQGSSAPAANNVSVRAYATDPAGNSRLAAARPVVAVDVAPYITAIVDSTGVTANVLRGSTGKYTIRNDGNTLTVRGYNFGTSAPTVYVSQTAGNPSAGVAASGVTVPASGQFTFTKSLTRSGYLTVRVGTIYSFNNENDDDLAQNSEATSDPRTAGWTDDRYLWAWAATQMNISYGTNLGTGNITGFTYPDMVMNQNTPEFSFVDDAVGNVNYTTTVTGASNNTEAAVATASATRRTGFRTMSYATMGQATVNTTLQRFILTVMDSTYGVNNTGTGHLEVTGFADQANNDGIGQTTSPSSGPDDSGNLRWSTIQGNDYYDGNQTNNTYRAYNRFPYPKMIAEARTITGIVGANQYGANLYVAYYDAGTTAANLHSLNFVSFRKTGAAFAQPTGTNGVNTAGDNLTNNAQDYARSSQVFSIPGTQNIGSGDRASQYFDMVKIPGTQAIAIAYYDPSTTSLMLAYSANAFNSTATNALTDNLTNMSATWATMSIDATADVGQYVKMVASGGRLYMAYYDFTNANLKMARVTWNGAGTPNAISISTIDGYQSTGTWNNIAMVANGDLTGQATAQPVITYYADSYNGTKSPIRMAFPLFDATSEAHDGTTALDDEGTYTGYWEITAVPAISTPKGGSEKFQKTQLGLYDAVGAFDNANLPVVGWVGDKPEYAKLLPSS
jgi:hypothetical protein